MRFRWLSTVMVLALAVLGLTANVAYAQTTGDIDGTVTDTNGAPLPGASITIASSTLQGTRTAVSDAAGRFRFPAVPAGTYVVTAQLSGFTKVEKRNIVVTLGAVASVPVQLSVSVKEEVVVTGEAPVIDTTKTVIGTSTSAEAIQKLPLTRNYTSIAFRAPGTGTDQAGGTTVYGATSLENSYVIDGVNTSAIKGYGLGGGAGTPLDGNQGKQLNPEFVQEVEVKTGGFEAEYGRALGGTINVVTKSGGNEFHGDAFAYYDSPNVAAADAHAADRAAEGLASANIAKRVDFGADIGGYFLKDRVWFFGAYDRVNRDQDYTRQLTARTGADVSGPSCSPNCPTSAGTTPTRTNLFSGKLTFRLGEANTIAVAAFGDPAKFENYPQGVVGPDSADLASADYGGTDVSAKYDGIFGTQFLLQAQYGYHNEKQTFGGSVPGADTATTYRKSQTGFLTEYYPNSGFSGLPADENYKRNAFKLAGTFFAGSHEIKAGGDYEDITSSFTQAYSGPAPNGARITRRFTASGTERTTQHRYYAQVPAGLTCLKTFDGSPIVSGVAVPVSNCAGWAPGLDFANPETQNLAFFAQDSWKVLRNLTVNVGIRYEQQKLIGVTDAVLIKLNDEWSPRVGVVWDAMNNGRSKIYGSYGRFYTTIPQDIQTRSLGREAISIVTNNTHSNVLDPIQTGSGGSFVQTSDLVNPNGIKGMYQDEIIVGMEFELIKNWSFGIKGIYKNLGRVVEDRCDLPGNPDVSAILSSNDPYIQQYQPTCAVINVGAGDTLSTIKDPADPQCYPNGATDESGSYVTSSPCTATQPRRKYRGIELDLSHRFAQNFFVQASYIYSRLEGNYSGNLSQTRETGQADPNINADFDYPGLVTNSYGLLRNDSPHQAKLTGYYSFPFGLTAGMNFTFRSGRPINLIGCPNDYPSCASGYSLEGYLVPKGSYGRMPSIYEGDFHLEYALRLGAVSITPVVDIFNFLNRQGVTSDDDVYNNQGDNALNVPCTNAAGQKGFFASCAPNANYGKPIAWQAPRSIRFGARVSF